MSPLTESTRLTLAKQSVAATDTNIREVSLLLHGNGTNGSTTITDNSPSPKNVVPVGNAQISTAQSKFGGSSIVFDGTSSGIEVANNNALKFGNGNFTLEYWIYPTNLTGVQTHFNTDGSTDNTNTSYAILTVGNSLRYYLGSSSANWDVALGVLFGTVSLNTWQHIALVRNANVFTPYVNGISGTTTTSSSALFAFTNVLSIGAANLSSPSRFLGYIDDFRITKGVARYTSNFTPPTLPFPDF
jgi:hypothetical protein